MGLFDLFKGKGKGGTATGGDSESGSGRGGWAARLDGYWDWEEEKKWEVAPLLLADVGKEFDNPRTKTKREDDEIELRARRGEHPLRVQFEADMGWVSLEMKATNRAGIFTLEWDPEKGPIERDEDEDWGDDDAGVRVFVAKGVFLEDDWPDVEEQLGVLGTLPQPFVEDLYGSIQTLRLQRFTALPDRLSLGFAPNFYEMADPVAEIVEAADLMARAADTIAAGTRDITAQPSVFVGGAVQVAHPQRVTCSYCQTQFPLGQGARCPNCGAPYSE